MSHRPRKLNPFQRALVAPWFVYALLIYVALLGIVDVVRMSRGFLQNAEEPVSHVNSVAIRLVVAGVFFELRGNFVKHLLGEEAARRAADAHLSETCEIYGGYITVAGLFIELVDNTRELLHPIRLANPVATVVTIVLSVLSLHVMSDLVRALRRRP